MSGGVGSPSSVRSYTQKVVGGSSHDLGDVDSMEEDTGSYHSAESPASSAQGAHATTPRSMSQRRLSASSSRGGSAPAVSVAGSAPGGGGGDICSVRGTESRVCPSDDDDPTGVGGGPGDSLGGGGGGVGTGWNSDDEDLEQSPWSDIISKYLKGTTRGQILEYGKLIRPHICHKSSRTCKFKRATRAYRLCYKHQRPYYECRSQRRSKRQPVQQPSGAAVPAQQPVSEGGPLLHHHHQTSSTSIVEDCSTAAAANPLSAVATTAVSTPAVTSSEVTAAVSAAAAAAALMTSPRAATPLLFAFPQSGTYHPGGPTLTGNVTSQTAAATASVNLSAGSRSGLPYPPLYCHDSGLWTDGGGAAVAVVPTVGAAAAAVSKVTTAAAGLTLSPSHHSQAGPFVGAYPAGPPGTTTAYFATPAAVLHHQAGPFSVGSTAGGFAVAGGQIQSQLGLQSHQQQLAVRQRVASGMSGQQGAGMSSDKMGYFLSHHHHHHHHPHGQSAAAAAAVQSTVGGGTLSRTPSSVPNSTPQSKARPPLVNLQATTQHYVSAKLANSTNFHQVAQQQQVAGSGGGGGRGHSLHSPHPQQQQRNLQPQQPQAMLNTTNSASVVTPSSPSTRLSHQQRPNRIRPSIVENSEGVVRSATTNPVDNRLAEPAEEAGGSTTVTTGGGGGGGGTSLMDDLMDTAEASAIMEVLFQQVPDIEEQVALATAADSAAAVATGGVTAANSEGRGGGTRSCSEEATGDAAGQRATASQEEQNYLNLVEAEKKSRHDSAMS